MCIFYAHRMGLGELSYPQGKDSRLFPNVVCTKVRDGIPAPLLRHKAQNGYLCVEDVTLPLGLELSLGRAQSIYLKKERDIKTLCNTIVNNLPENVIDSIAQPFFVDGDTTYYFEMEATYRDGENCNIIHNFREVIFK